MANYEEATVTSNIRRPRYTLIKGSFYILYPDLPRNGPQPDGDTVNILPDDDGLVQSLKRLQGRAAERKHLGNYSVRFEGIDALETHFHGQHQNPQFAEAARDKMLAKLGFGSVQFWPTQPNNVKKAQHHPVRGHIFAIGIESNGRILAQVHPGEPARGLSDGQQVVVDEARLDSSVNALLIREGLAYAELYSTMPIDLIRHMRKLVKAARAAGKGFWPQESLKRTGRLQLNGMADLAQLVVFPKLYRRLIAHFEAGYQGLREFDAWVRADTHRDDRALLPTGEVGNLHDLYNVGRGGIKLRYYPEDLMFDPD
ncbi:MAG: thermonuclease family protein [Planctomycetes bacterium]|nr:thermonuclease family protein [Planctomycetota bacterium]